MSSFKRSKAFVYSCYAGLMAYIEDNPMGMSIFDVYDFTTFDSKRNDPSAIDAFYAELFVRSEFFTMEVHNEIAKLLALFCLQYDKAEHKGGDGWLKLTIKTADL